LNDKYIILYKYKNEKDIYKSKFRRKEKVSEVHSIKSQNPTISTVRQENKQTNIYFVQLEVI
jgi:hypothetical protein